MTSTIAKKGLVSALTLTLCSLVVGGCDSQERTITYDPASGAEVELVQHSSSNRKADLGFPRVETDGVFVIIDKEPTALRIKPDDLAVTVPAARVRERLLKMQLDSFNREQFIVRFEVVHFEPKVLPSLYDENALEHDGLVSIALVYKASLKPGSIPISSKGVKIFDAATAGPMAGQSVSPELTELTIDVLRFELAPLGVEKRDEEGGKIYILGAKDWKVVNIEKIKSVSADEFIKGLPILDPSAVEFSN